jgi:methionyl-tRNA formyltransferase
MTPHIDAGPCLAQASLAIDPEETAADLEPKLARLGAPLVCQTIDDLQTGSITPLPQDRSLSTKAPRLKKSDGEIRWNRPAAAIKNQIRALEPWPKTDTWWHRAGSEPLRLILGRVQALSGNTPQPPGTALESAGDRLVIATGEGSLQILELQPSGKRMLTTAEFLRGYPVKPGDRFGPETAKTE